MQVRDKYEVRSPASQNIVDMFEGEWTSLLPRDAGIDVDAGKMPLFEDPRVAWAQRQLGGFDGCSVLELGPLEGGHTYMAHQGGAREIVAIEANRHAFLRCLCVKELYQLDRARFLLGDFVQYLESTTRTFDVTIASGVLYHMINPVRALELMARSANKLYLWTHYYDAALIGRNAAIASRFGKLERSEHEGRVCETAAYEYREAMTWAGFTGGTQPSCRWMSRDTIVGSLRAAGFAEIAFNFEEPEHPHGPAFALCAQR